MQLDKTKIQEFQKKIFTWWESKKREFPWRNTTNPYYIMLSEFMLQQTQTTRVIPKYNQFIDQFPTIHDIAEASRATIIGMWQGLGYNKRAVWLHEACQEISQLPEFPQKREVLIQFKGIGPYTSRSIPIFAFNANYAAVDTNIRRILIVEGFTDEDKSKAYNQSIADQILPVGRSRDWHNALMDYGALELSSRKTGISPRSSSSRFQGSNRQKRGQIVRYINENSGPVTELELAKQLNIDQEKLTELVDSLSSDGLLVLEDDKIFLPD